jgi:hypothetical protein
VRSRAWIAALLSVGLVACGSSDDDRDSVRTPDPDRPAERGAAPERERADERRGAPTEAEKAVIRGWANTLRAGHVAEAARFFAVPSVVANGGPLLRLPSRAAAEQFNRALPCGARLLETERGQRSYVIATFRLTERPGRGSCDTGTGALARTAFLIRDRRIVEWVRVADPPAAESGVS